MLSLLEKYLGSDLTAPLIFVVVFLIVYYAIHRPSDLPPGPSIFIPMLGNLPSIAVGGPLEAFQKWRKRFGDVYSVYFGSKLVVVLNGYKTIKEAYVHQGANFSDRPRNELMDAYIKDQNGVVFNSGEAWKRERKFMKSALQKMNFGRPAFQNNIHSELEVLMSKLEVFKGDPFDMREHVTFSIANIINVLISGKRVPEGDPSFTKYLKLLDEAAIVIARASLMLTCFPFLRFLPWDVLGMKLYLDCRACGIKYISDLHRSHVKTADDATPGDLLDICEGVEGRRDKDNYEVFYELFAAGTETTTNTLMWTILYLLNNPEVQTKCREEIHGVLGTDQLPTMDIKPSLPYVSATILETLRCSTVAPLALPHKAAMPTTLNGYRIPDEANIFTNLNSIFHDPEMFDEPKVFRPERFLNQKGEVEVPEYFIPFGVGRRICLGEAAAKMELFLFLTALIQRFILLPEGSNPPEVKGILGITYSPNSFKVRCVRCN